MLSQLGLDCLQLNTPHAKLAHSGVAYSELPVILAKRGELQPVGQIQPTSCFHIAREIKMFFILLYD